MGFLEMMALDLGFLSFLYCILQIPYFDHSRVLAMHIALNLSQDLESVA